MTATELARVLAEMMSAEGLARVIVSAPGGGELSCTLLAPARPGGIDVAAIHRDGMAPCGCTAMARCDGHQAEIERINREWKARRQHDGNA